MERRTQQRMSPPDWHGVTVARQGGREKFLGTVKDLSAMGLGISANIDCRPGTILELKLVLFEGEIEECALEGEVRWCDADPLFEGNYQLGLETRHASGCSYQPLRCGCDTSCRPAPQQPDPIGPLEMEVNDEEAAT